MLDEEKSKFLKIYYLNSKTCLLRQMTREKLVILVKISLFFISQKNDKETFPLYLNGFKNFYKNYINLLKQ